MENAEDVGEAVETVVEQISDNADAAIEDAARRADEARETAEKIADAAMATEHGQRMTRMEERINEWQARMEAEKLETENRIAAMETGITEKLNSVLSSLIPPNSNPEANPPVLEEIPTSEIPANLENAEGQKEAEAEAVEVVEVRKPRRRWM